MHKKPPRRIALSLCLALPAIALASCTPPVAVTTSPTPSVAASTPPNPATPSAAPTTASPSPTPVASASPSASSSPSASPTTAAKPGKTLRISVINNSSKVLVGLYFSPPDKKDWGPNEIAGQKIPNREKVDFDWNQADYKGTEAGCIFDVRSEYADATTTELDALDLCKESSINFK
jgi:hypothetical protein